MLRIGSLYCHSMGDQDKGCVWLFQTVVCWNGDICRLYDIFEDRLELNGMLRTSFDHLYAEYAGLLETEKFAVVS